MLKQIHLQNFLSFKDIILDFNTGLNVMVGINGSGKSNLFRAIELLKQGVSRNQLKEFVIDRMGGLDNILFKERVANPSYNHSLLKFVFDGKILGDGGFPDSDDITYTVKLKKIPSSSNYHTSEKVESSSGSIYLDFSSGSGVLGESVGNDSKALKFVQYTGFVSPQELALSQIFDSDRYYVLATIRNAIKDIEVYHYFDTTSSSSIRKPALPTSEKRLLPAGANLTQILNTIKINSKSNFGRITALMNEINPNFSEIDFNFIGGYIELMLGEKNLEGSIHVSNISDGTLHYLCLLAILLNDQRGKLVCIDEPESGLHPDMINGIARLFDEKSIETQFMISTHSEILLDNFNVEDVLVFEKDGINSTAINRYSGIDFQGWYQQFFPGRMWRAGDLGGNRW